MLNRYRTTAPFIRVRVRIRDGTEKKTYFTDIYLTLCLFMCHNMAVNQQTFNHCEEESASTSTHLVKRRRTELTSAVGA